MGIKKAEIKIEDKQFILFEKGKNGVVKIKEDDGVVIITKKDGEKETRVYRGYPYFISK